MITISTRNVSSALPEALRLLKTQGVERLPRNGKCRVVPVPVTTVYERPLERVLFDPLRDANPFFHLLEAMGFLAGRDDLDYYAYFSKNMAEFSDDGKTLGASYGVRWRRHFGFDQLAWAVERLKANPEDRRVVLSMWDPYEYPEGRGLDESFVEVTTEPKSVPCNLSALPWVGADGALNLTVFNRSNDSVWGAYGANAVHFAFLLEYLAAGVGRPVGRYWQVSNNLHVYERHYPLLDSLAAPDHPDDAPPNPYETLKPEPLVESDVAQFDCDLRTLMEHGPEDEGHGLVEPFLKWTVKRAWRSYVCWREGLFDSARDWAENIAAPDWRRACVEWLRRREAKRALSR